MSLMFWRVNDPPPVMVEMLMDGSLPLYRGPSGPTMRPEDKVNDALDRDRLLAGTATLPLWCFRNHRNMLDRREFNGLSLSLGLLAHVAVLVVPLSRRNRHHLLEFLDVFDGS